MWYLLKVEYSAAAAKDDTKIVGFGSLSEAQHVLAKLELSYQLNQPIRIQNGDAILVKGAWLYESFRDQYAAAVDAIAAGEATLMGQTHGVDLKLT